MRNKWTQCRCFLYVSPATFSKTKVVGVLSSRYCKMGSRVPARLSAAPLFFPAEPLHKFSQSSPSPIAELEIIDSMKIIFADSVCRLSVTWKACCREAAKRLTGESRCIQVDTWLFIILRSIFKNTFRSMLLAFAHDHGWPVTDVQWDNLHMTIVTCDQLV